MITNVYMRAGSPPGEAGLPAWPRADGLLGAKILEQPPRITRSWIDQAMDNVLAKDFAEEGHQGSHHAGAHPVGQGRHLRATAVVNKAQSSRSKQERRPSVLRAGPGATTGQED